MNLVNFFLMATAAEMASGRILKQSWLGVSQKQSAVAEHVYIVVKWAVNLC